VIRLSVNVNKVATLRNARGGDFPNVLDAVRVCLEAGSPGITVHPREDQRHITTKDVYAIAEALAPLRNEVEYNIEGDPRPGLIELAHAVRPHQCTLVPVIPGEITSQAGWSKDTSPAQLQETIEGLRSAGIRVSVFVDPQPEPIRWAASVGADRVELFTEPFARAFAESHEAGRRSFETYVKAAEVAHEAGLGINAGHDLDLDNLVLFRELPHLAEVSIGHALIGRSLFEGLGTVVREYLQVISPVA